MLTHHLTKTSAKGAIYWQITQDGNLTNIEYGQSDGRGRRELPAIKHDSPHEAHLYVQRQLQQKKRQGYKNGGKRTSEFQTDYNNEPHRKKNRPLPQHYDGEFDYEDRTVPAASNVDLQQKIQRLHRKKNRTLEEDVLLANARADAKRLGMPMDITDDDGDTDSVASSTSSFGKAPRGRRIGVSPLNKRRSVRLALKRGSTAEMAADMRQNSVEMTTPPHLARLNTQQRWGSWRPKRQATSTLLKPGNSIADMDTSSPRVLVRKPALMKRGSTTTFLRQALNATAINEEILVPKVFDDNKSTEDAAKNSQANAGPFSNNLRKSMTRLGTRSTVQIMPSLSERESPDVSESSPSLSVPAMKGATSSTAPRMKRTETRPRLLKRSSTTEVREAEPSSKRTKRAALSRCQSISAITRLITLPHRDTWPVQIVAQVVWRVPLTIPGLAGRGHAVSVQTDRCLVGEDSGKVFVIDETVSVKHVTQLPAGITHVNQDGQFVYGVCSNGQVYDISQAEPRLVFELKTKGKDFCLDAFDGVLFACDSQGHVARYDHNSEVVWKTRNSIGEGYMVCAGDEGVLCCSSVGVTSLSLRDGSVLWETPLRDSAIHAVKRDELLYVACGSNVLRIDTTTGQITKTYKYPKRGKGAAPNLSRVAVGGGLVFACGRNIICFEEQSGDIVFVLEPPVTPCRAVQYFEGRVFYVGDSCMSVLDFAPDVIAKAKEGRNLDPVDIGPKVQSPIQTPLQRLPTVVATSQSSLPGVEVECFRPEPRKSRLKVRAISQGYSGELDVQFPSVSSYLPGTKFVVHDLKRSETGGFYRVLGDIKQVTDS